MKDSVEILVSILFWYENDVMFNCLRVKKLLTKVDVCFFDNF